MRILLSAIFFGVSAILGGLLGLPGQAEAHHILGRPAYNLNEDSNTPPSMQAEVEVDGYQITYMIYPAFPQPGDSARVSLYILGEENGKPYDGKVTFTMRQVPWLSWIGVHGHEDRLGVQPPDGKVYRQGFVVPEAGDYMISTRFEAGGEHYVIDFPIRIGPAPLIGPYVLAAGAVVVLLLVVAVIRRRKSMTAKIRDART